jgi:hypothetical protein
MYTHSNQEKTLSGNAYDLCFGTNFRAGVTTLALVGTTALVSATAYVAITGDLTSLLKGVNYVISSAAQSGIGNIYLLRTSSGLISEATKSAMACSHEALNYSYELLGNLGYYLAENSYDLKDSADLFIQDSILDASEIMANKINDTSEAAITKIDEATVLINQILDIANPYEEYRILAVKLQVDPLGVYNDFL